MVDLQELLKYTSSLKLLYVEDDEMIRERNTEIFLDFFSDITVANNGEEGLEKYLKHKSLHGTYINIVITDIRMPKMNGITMSQLIKEVHPQQVIIVLSAHRDSEYLFELINMGVSYFLPKPTSIETLYEMLFTTSKIIHDTKAADDHSRQLSALNSDLESKITELKTAIQKAEEATEFKNRFLANMSHEIRTPMNAIIGLSHILLRSVLQESQHDNVKKIENSANILLQIINNILDYSKIEAGKLELECIEFDLNSVMAHLASTIDITAASKDLEVIYSINGNVSPFFMGDPVRLGQILLNLMTNAVKFTNHGKIELHVNRVNLKDNISTLEFQVIDEGIGIAKEKLNVLFHSFVQADNSVTRKYGGSGLGLAIVKRLVKKMDGTINVYSREGEGTTFTLRIPLHTVNTLSNSKEQAHTISSILLHNKTILLVEDNEINRHVVINFLDNSGATVLIANDGKAALNTLKERDDVDLILMDINMPVMDGFEATKKIREELNLTSIPILGISANAMQKDINKALGIGMNDYISKPINIQKFYTVLAQYIDDAQLLYDKENETNIHVNHPLRTIKGFNIDDGLERMEGNMELYEKVIHGFFEMFKNSSQQLQELIQNREYDSAFKLCHDIKGSSGNISATTLYTITKELEKAISSHQYETALTHLKEYTKEFLRLSTTVNTKGF
ncbi:MAG: response regulator [Campylobacterota bacterium]|nr:response regulator [Campylobacterota bacterium]